MPIPVDVEAIRKKVPTEISQLAEWYNHNFKDKTDPAEKQGIGKLNEYFTIESTYINNMARLREELHQYITTDKYKQLDESKRIIPFEKLSEEEKELIKQYSNKLELLLQAYLALQSHAPITKMESTPAEVIKAIGEKMETKEFETYNSLTIDLAVMQQKIFAITAFQNMKIETKKVTKIETQRFSDLNIIPVQHLPRFPIHFKPLVDTLGAIAETSSVFPKTSYDVSIKILGIVTKFADASQFAVGNLDSAAVAIEQMKKIKTTDLPSFALRAILGLNFNNPLPQNTEQTEVRFPDSYIKEILVKAYPNLFGYDGKKDLTILTPHDKPDQYINVSAALGMSLVERNSKFTFNPQKFDANKLDELYKADNNLLWLVLKSTKPIDKDFTADQKIQTYIELANLFEDKRIGAQKKYSSVVNLAKAAFAIAKEHPECTSQVIENFGPNSKHGEWITKKIGELPIKEKSDPANIIVSLTKGALLALTEKLTQAKSQLSTSIALLEVEKERKAFLETLGGPGTTEKSHAAYVEGLRSSVLTGSGGGFTKEAVAKMPLSTLMNNLVWQWQNSFETQKSTLTEQVSTVTALTKELVSIKNQLLPLSEELTAAKEKNKTQQEQLDLATKKGSTLTERIKALEKENGSLKGVDKLLTETRGQLDKVNAEKGALAQQMEQSQSQVTKLQSDISALTSTVEKQEEQIKSLTSEVVSAREKAQKLEQSSTEVQALNETLTSDLAKVKEELVQSRRQLSTLSDENLSLKEKLAASAPVKPEGEVIAQQTDNASLEEKLGKATTLLAEKSSELADKDKEIERLKQQLATTAQNIENTASFKKEFDKIKPKTETVTDEQIKNLISGVAEQHTKVSEKRMNVIGGLFASAKHKDSKGEYLKEIKSIHKDTTLSAERKLDRFTDATERYMEKLANGKSVRYLNDLRDALGMGKISTAEQFKEVWNKGRPDLSKDIMTKIGILPVEQLVGPNVAQS